jgi:hypothetical protein
MAVDDTAVGLENADPDDTTAVQLLSEPLGIVPTVKDDILKG